MIASKANTRMSSLRRPKSTGWAAFDLQQRHNDGLQAQSTNELFPSLPSTVTSFQPAETLLRNNRSPVKPFSSVVMSSIGFPKSTVDFNKTAPSEVGGSFGPQSSGVSQENKYGEVFRQLKEQYSWAENSLIADVLANAGHNFDMASSFLNAMVSDESSGRTEDNTLVTSSCDSIEHKRNDRTLHGKKVVSTGRISEPSKRCSIFQSHVGNGQGNVRDGSQENDPCAEKLLNGCMDVDAMFGQLTHVPIEPEWEEDDVYLSCRKDAIKMMRAAARHSKAATNSFLRGDHFSAQQFSMKAQEEWVVAQRLNAKAANEILSLRNENNGIWRLDLHGLHATEAVQALQERLHMIETQVFFKGPGITGLPNNFRTTPEAVQASPSGGRNSIGRLDDPSFPGQKPKWLEVITGIGNHSRGGAALPIAVRTFLADNGYRFDEARPGVLMVRPKIRHS